MAPHLTQEQRKAIVALRDDGCRIREIERKTGISRPTIYFWLKRHDETGDLTTHHRQNYKRSTTAEQDDAIVDAHLEHPHLPTASTASQYNISTHTVRRRLREASLRRPAVELLEIQLHIDSEDSETNFNNGGPREAQHEVQYKEPEPASRTEVTQAQQVSTQPVRRRRRAAGLRRRRKQRDTAYEGKHQTQTLQDASADDSEHGFSLTDGTAEKDDAVKKIIPLAPSDISMDPEAEDAYYPKDTPEPAAPPEVTPKRSRKKSAALEDQLECSRCCEDIQQHTALFRCLECADAALCWRCMPQAHKKHCVMRLPSARVYRVLEGIFNQLRLEVRSRLYPDNVLGPDCKQDRNGDGKGDDDDDNGEKKDDDWAIEQMFEQETETHRTRANESKSNCIAETEVTIKQEYDNSLDIEETTVEESDQNIESAQKFPTLCNVLKRHKREAAEPNTRPAEPNAKPQVNVKPASNSSTEVKSQNSSNTVKPNILKRPSVGQQLSNCQQTSDMLMFFNDPKPSDSPEPSISSQPNSSRQPNSDHRPSVSQKNTRICES